MSQPNQPIDGIFNILGSKPAGVAFSRAQVAAIAGIASSLVSTVVWQWLYFGRVDESRKHSKSRD